MNTNFNFPLDSYIKWVKKFNLKQDFRYDYFWHKVIIDSWDQNYSQEPWHKWGHHSNVYFCQKIKCLSELCNSLIILFALTAVDLKSKRPFRIQFTRAKVNRMLMFKIIIIGSQSCQLKKWLKSYVLSKLKLWCSLSLTNNFKQSKYGFC